MVVTFRIRFLFVLVVVVVDFVAVPLDQACSSALRAGVGSANAVPAGCDGDGSAVAANAVPAGYDGDGSAVAAMPQKPLCVMP